MIHAFCEQWTRFAFMPLHLHGATNDSSPAAPAAAPQPAAAIPRFLSRTCETPHGTLAYKLYIPASFDREDPALVVMLHGCGQNADDFASGTGMNAHAEQAGCLVMYPEQNAYMAGGCWNWFENAHRQREEGDAARIAAGTRAVAGEFGVPPGRTFVAGLSAGAAMAVVLGATFPELFAAVGCHSGLPHGCAADTASALQAMHEGASIDSVTAAGIEAPARLVPVIVFHGDNDQTVHIANGRMVIERSLGGRDGTEVWQETGVARGREFTRVVHRRPGGAVLAEHWVIHGAGHAWSGGDPRGSYTDKKGPCASGEMLRFFNELSGRPDRDLRDAA